MLILTVHDPFERDQPVYLLAQVVRSRAEPPYAIGIQWKKAISRFGFMRLKKFLDAHFHLVVDPQKMGAWTQSELDGAVAYDFVFGSVEKVDLDRLSQLDEADTYYGLKVQAQFLPKAQYLEVRLVQSGDEAKHSRPFRRELSMDAAAVLHVDRYGMGEVVTQPITVDAAESGGMSADEVAEWKYDMKQRKRVRIPAVFSIQGRTLQVQVHNMTSNALLILADDVRPAKGDRTIVEMPLTIDARSGIVIVMAEVKRVARDKNTRRVGIDLSILSIDEQGQQGLFNQYLLAL